VWSNILFFHLRRTNNLDERSPFKNIFFEIFHGRSTEISWRRLKNISLEAFSVERKSWMQDVIWWYIWMPASSKTIWKIQLREINKVTDKRIRRELEIRCDLYDFKIWTIVIKWFAAVIYGMFNLKRNDHKNWKRSTASSVEIYRNVESA